MHRRQGRVEHKSPLVYHEGSDIGGGGSAIHDDAGTGRRRSLAAAAGLSIATSPGGSERQPGHTVAAPSSAQSREGHYSPMRAEAGTGGAPVEMLFAALDTDGDGVITRQEMRDGFSGKASGGTRDNHRESEIRDVAGLSSTDGLGADERSVLRGDAVGDSPTQWYAECSQLVSVSCPLQLRPSASHMYVCGARLFNCTKPIHS